MTVEDFLARRSRQLFLDARTAIELAPRIAELMAKETGKDEIWKTEQINIFRNMAGQYLPS
jgi:glycerol-3-phosphate dehydrogenase